MRLTVQVNEHAPCPHYAISKEGRKATHSLFPSLAAAGGREAAEEVQGTPELVDFHGLVASHLAARNDPSKHTILVYAST